MFNDNENEKWIKVFPRGYMNRETRRELKKRGF